MLLLAVAILVSAEGCDGSVATAPSHADGGGAPDPGPCAELWGERDCCALMAPDRPESYCRWIPPGFPDTSFGYEGPDPYFEGGCIGQENDCKKTGYCPPGRECRDVELWKGNCVTPSYHRQTVGACIEVDSGE